MTSPVRKEDFAFSLTVAGSLYDVYHFHKDGKPGTLAFRQVAGQWEISVLEAGHLDEKTVRRRLKGGN